MASIGKSTNVTQILSLGELLASPNPVLSLGQILENNVTEPTNFFTQIADEIGVN